MFKLTFAVCLSVSLPLDFFAFLFSHLTIRRIKWFLHAFHKYWPLPWNFRIYRLALYCAVELISKFGIHYPLTDVNHEICGFWKSEVLYNVGIYHVVISVSLSLSAFTLQPKQTIMGRKRLNFNKYKINNNTEKIKRKLFAAKLSTVWYGFDESPTHYSSPFFYLTEKFSLNGFPFDVPMKR